MSSMTYYDKDISKVATLHLKSRINDNQTSVKSKKEALSELKRRSTKPAPNQSTLLIGTNDWRNNLLQRNV